MTWPPTLPPKFPLTVSGRGYYKRIGGRPRWVCGKVPPEQALLIWHRKANAYLTGQKPIAEPKRVTGPVTMHWLLNRWLIDRRADAQRGELESATWMQYKLSAQRIDLVAGQTMVDDWLPDHTRSVYDALAQKHGLDFAKRAIGHLRTACAHAGDHGWCRPVRIGTRIVAKLASRPAPNMKWRLLTPTQIRAILADVDRRIGESDGRAKPSFIQLKAMILLALNGGFGAREVSELLKSSVDLPGARILHRRGKTDALHVVPLWPETVDALKPVLEQRPEDELLFRTREGNPWSCAKPVQADGKLKRVIVLDHVNERYKEILEPLGLRVKGTGFYKLRHLFATTADKCQDTNAVSLLMGHSIGGAKAHYIRVGDDRLRAVVDFVRHELLGR